jgi:hypothetical protein
MAAKRRLYKVGQILIAIISLLSRNLYIGGPYRVAVWRPSCFDIRTILISGLDRLFDNRTCPVIELSLYNYHRKYVLVEKTMLVELGESQPRLVLTSLV